MFHNATIKPFNKEPDTDAFGTLRLDDAKALRTSKTTKGGSRQNNNFAHESHYFVHFFAVFARLRREIALFYFLGPGRRNFILFLKLEYDS